MSIERAAQREIDLLENERERLITKLKTVRTETAKEIFEAIEKRYGGVASIAGAFISIPILDADYQALKTKYGVK